ncbi:hypothetical protein EJ06DRAFT_527326 [Trichodelitschia bisporula]|uniref:LCCL domain-containing protein n=1 Tax=Trichodelitschia bisporula TaxID=703511 RepID=A0A6G1I633_9PEZI|nr:hypothetical protein EJ06DRAFT_527326 [Trichodelitschia bisporula]
MAAPKTVNIHDLTGTYILNRSLSDDTDAILALQGIGWLTRKVISTMTITLHTKQYKDEQGLEHIDIEQPGVGFKTTELRTLDGQWREHEDYVFGAVKGKSIFIKTADLNGQDPDEAYLKEGWNEETASGDVVESVAESIKNGWAARQIWGFEEVEVNGKKERRYVRHIVVKKKEKTIHAKLVYDFQEPSAVST